MHIEPRKALNKAFLKIKPNRSGIELFKSNLITLLNHAGKEREEFHKNLIADFLKNTYYSPNHFINTKDSKDLVIHTGKDASSPVGVIIEAKSPANKAEMLSEKNLNSKALQELVLYFLRERITHKNLEIKHLVATNLNEWFIFDGQLFDKLFAQNKAFVKQFQEFEEGKLSGTSTDFFYREMAKPFIETLLDKIEYTYFDLASYDKILRNDDKTDDTKLIVLYKLLSPEHLLKLSFANDSNSLDKNFYNELLHLIGLTETKEGGKKLIERPKAGQRLAGSLLENTMNQLDSLDKINRLPNVKQYGDTYDERLFTVALELCITWVNRILFLKLLEAQLIAYHKGDKRYAFLHADLIPDYDQLNALFFMVLAQKPEDRNDRVKIPFANVPYLNSSLFEPTDLEHHTLFISGLEDHVPLPYLSGTVIKDANGKKKTGEQGALPYFFSFLDAYDFASEGSEDIQEDNKTLINASVLGLIFEKINGYKDGSFYTPSFITMYMCKETIRRAVLQKFNEVKGWDCADFDQLYNTIDDSKEANTIINSIKICDPAVGSGHFLVSALNEMIAIKHDLKVLVDRDGKRLKEYHIDIVNDELIVTDEDSLPFVYNPNNIESQRIQETLFHEKQTIIENCLFGVDINPNSVKICRLRLWIELLKNAYYRENREKSIENREKSIENREKSIENREKSIENREKNIENRRGGLGFRELETLPNIDINIKCGNSLISRFGLEADLKKALKQSKWNIESYKLAVATYRNAENKEQKREMEQLIADIKGNFRSEIAVNDPKKLRLEKLKGELFNYTQQVGLFERSKKEQTEWNKKVNTLSADVQKLETELEEIKSNKIYENAFEWRFEFPEVLNDQGDFVGFDVVIGNPPYGAKLSEEEKKLLLNKFRNQDYQLDTYLLFNEQAIDLMKEEAEFSFIIPNTWLTNIKFKKIRKYIVENTYIHEISHYKKAVFDDAVVDTQTLFFKKIKKANKEIKINIIENIENKNSLNCSQNDWISLNGETINITISNEELLLKRKIESNNKNLGTISNVVSGMNPYEVGKGNPKQSKEDVKNRIYDSKEKKSDSYKRVLRGSDINRYKLDWKSGVWILYGDNLAAPRYSANFENDEKIVVRQTSDSIIATLDVEKFICLKNLHIITSLENSNFNLKYILSLINSKLLDYYHYLLNPEKGEALAEIKKENLEKLPIKQISHSDQQPFIEKVDQILALKKDNPLADTIALEREIDWMVYGLYGLSEEEINIVENS